MTDEVDYAEGSGNEPAVPSGSARPGAVRLPGWVRLIKVVSIALAIPAAAACVALMLHVISDVIGRTFFNQPVQGTLEVTEHWWMITIVFAGLGYTQVQREHIRATAVIDLLSDRWQRASEVIATTLLAGIALVIAWYGWTAALESHQIREATSSSPPVTIWPFLFLMPLGGIALALQSIATIYEVTHGITRYSHAEELI